MLTTRRGLGFAIKLLTSMPWTLYRYILRELVKVLVLTTAVMVVVLSFVSAIGPLSDGLLGPVSLVKFVLYTMPTVLGFALPFAGAFSATVVFHGLAKDNELLACRASGLSYSRIFAPVAGLGLVLMAVLLLLSNTLVPGFWKAAKRTVEGDVLGVLVSQLNQNRPYIFADNGLVLYADAAETRDPPADSSTEGLTAERFIVMRNVAVGQYDKQSGRLLNDTTASVASALLVRDDFGRAYISLRLQDPVFYDAQTGQLQTVGRFGEIETDQPILLPNPISDEAVFFTFADLMQLKHNPHDFDTVREAQSELAAAVARERLMRTVVDALSRERGGRGFVVLQSGLDDYYRVSAPRAEVIDGRLRLSGDGDLRVSIDRYDNAQLIGEPARRFESDDALLKVTAGRFELEPVIQITMSRVDVYSINGELNNKPEYLFPAMQYPDQVLGVDLVTLSTDELNKLAQADGVANAPAVRQARAMLRFNIIQLKHLIDAELYTRFATALATPLLLILGTLLAVRMRDRLPLVVFFWSFVLAVMTLVMIKTGGSMAERVAIEDVLSGRGSDRLIGVGVLWGGNLMLLMVIGRLYVKVAKN